MELLNQMDGFDILGKVKMMKSCFMFFEQTNLVLESVHNNGIVGGAKENFKSVAESHNEKMIMDNGEIEI